MKKTILFLFFCLWGFIAYSEDLLKDPKIWFTPIIGYQYNYNYLMKDPKDPPKYNDVNMPNSLYWGGLVQFNERNVWLSIKGIIYNELETGKLYHGLWDISADYKLLKKEPIFAHISLNSNSQYPESSNIEALVGNLITAGFHYNNLLDNRTYNQVVNLYGNVDYVIQGSNSSINYPFMHADFTNSFRNILGFVVNIQNFFFIEQNAIIYVEPTGLINMNPYFSDYETKLWIKYKKISIGYYHICHHTFVDGREGFPNISGMHDRFEFKIKF